MPQSRPQGRGAVMVDVATHTVGFVTSPADVDQRSYRRSFEAFYRGTFAARPR
ncbi:MAG TPA: hypothetical protein VFP34_14780 [Microlunatus sp.]|nr:hypothetical protein [Microlunatus sp.]